MASTYEHMYMYPWSQQWAAVWTVIITEHGECGELKRGMSAAHVKTMTEVGIGNYTPLQACPWAAADAVVA